MMPNLPYLMDYLEVKHWQSLAGKQLDQSYLSDMVVDHNRAVGEIKMAAQNLTDLELKKFVGKILPTLQRNS
jgi:predicted outer membrane protein